VKQDLVIINQDSGYLMIDIANAAASVEISCTLIAGRLVLRNEPLISTVRISKILCYDRRTTLNRLATWSIAFLQIWFLISFKYRSNHLLIVSNPPFAPLLPLFCSNRFSLLIYDVYPDSLVESGIFASKSWLIRLWRSANCRVFKRAERIFTITEGMKQVLQQYADEKPINVVSVWTDNTFLQPVSKESNPFIKKHRLENKFVVLYSGNLGYSHDIETIIDLAACVEDPDILFLIIGDGDQKQMVKEKIRTMGLRNCRMLPFQPASELPYSLSSADVAIVTLGRQASRLSVPSKTYNYMSVGSALLCIAEKNSDLAQLIEHFKIGESFSADQLKEMKDFLNEMKNNSVRLEIIRKNALAASSKFTSDNAKIILNSIYQSAPC